MGFFSKIGKGIKSAFKSIGAGIKSAFKRFGKFMNKIGVLGQVAMMFILPGVGSMLAKAWSGIAGQTATQAALSTVSQTAATTAAQGGANAAASTTAGELAKKVAMEGLKEGGKKAATALIKQTGAKATGLMAGGNFAQGVGKLMQFTGKVVGTPGRVFSNITQGVTETLGNFAKTASNNIFGTKFTTAAGNSLSGKFFSGGDSAFGRSFGDTSKFANVLAKSPTIATKEAVSNFQTTADSLAKLPQSSLNTQGLPNNMSPSQSPMKKLQDSTFGKNQPDYSSGRDFALEVNRPDGGFVKRDLSQPVKDFDTGKFAPKGFDMEQPLSKIKPFDANDLSLTADTTDSMLGQPTNLSPEARALYEQTNNIVPGENRSYTFEEQLKTPEGVPKVIGENQGMLSESGDILKKGPKGPDSLLSAPDPSFFDKLRTGITEIPTRIKDKATEIVEDPLGYAFKGFENSLQQGMQYKAKEALGLTPDMPDQYVTNTRAYVPTFDTGGGAGSYQAPETMNARAFEQNVLAAPAQYGYTAFQYDQYMNRTAQTS